MNKDLGNPLLAAMPKMLAPQELTREIQSLPPLPAAPSLEGLALLSSIFIPMDYMYTLYDQLYRAIRTTYTTRTVLEGIRQSNALFRGDAGIRGDAGTCFATQAAAGSVLGELLLVAFRRPRHWKDIHDSPLPGRHAPGN